AAACRTRRAASSRLRRTSSSAQFWTQATLKRPLTASLERARGDHDSVFVRVEIVAGAELDVGEADRNVPLALAALDALAGVGRPGGGWPGAPSRRSACRPWRRRRERSR